MGTYARISVMRASHTKTLRRGLALLSVAAAVMLTLTACGGGGEDFEFPAVKRGNNLTLVVNGLEEPEEIYYQDVDFAIYALRPSNPDNKLVALNVQVFNGRSNTVIMNVGDEGYVLLDKKGDEYKSLNPFGEERRLSPAKPANAKFFQFIWGKFEIPKDNSIVAWLVFDVPKDVEPNQLRWNALETVFVPFYGI